MIQPRSKLVDIQKTPIYKTSPSKPPVEVGIETNQPNKTTMCKLDRLQNNYNKMIVFGTVD